MITREHQRNFIKKIAPYAQEAYAKTGILASVLIGCSAKETLWGTDPSVEKANNYFCLFGSYNGQSYVEDKTFAFKKYPTGEESFIDFARTLKNNPLFKQLPFKNFEESVKIISSIHNDTFARTIFEIEKRYSITQYDKIETKKDSVAIVKQKDIKKTKDGNWQIHTEPDRESQWIGILLGGKEYLTEGTYGNWIKVKKGWVLDEAFEDKNFSRRIKIKRKPCWIYSKPDYFSLKLKEYQGPDLVEYQESIKGWYKIAEGWLSPTSIE